MTTQQQAKPYWKDVLRQAQIEIEATEEVEATDLSPAHNRKWANAYRQARADMKDPTAIVWLPEEIAPLIHEGLIREDIRQAHQEPSPSQSRPRRRRLTALLLAALLLIPAAVSYVLAYRRIVPHTR